MGWGFEGFIGDTHTAGGREIETDSKTGLLSGRLERHTGITSFMRCYVTLPGWRFFCSFARCGGVTGFNKQTASEKTD